MVWYTASVTLAAVNDRSKLSVPGTKEKPIVRVMVAVQDSTIASRQMQCILRDCNLFRVVTPTNETGGGSGGVPDAGTIRNQGAFDLEMRKPVKLAEDAYIDVTAEMVSTRVILAIETDEPYNDAGGFGR